MGGQAWTPVLLFGNEMTFYRRHLPHWHHPGHPVFVTWRLYASLPASVLLQLRLEATLEKPKKADQRELEKERLRKEARRFRLIDKLLDSGTTGPLWLKDPRIADCVVDTMRDCEGQLKLMNIHAYVVMANHVHALLTPRTDLARVTRTVKAYSARRANELLDRVGQAFWQDESFDHWIRNDASFARTKNYIEQNPVKAGLVQDPEDWPWSSARLR